MCGLTPSEPYRYTAYQNPQCTRDRGILHGSSGTRDLTFNFTRLSSKATCVLSTLISRCGAKTQVPTRDASAPRRTRRQRFHMHYHRTVCSSSHVPTSAAHSIPQPTFSGRLLDFELSYFGNLSRDSQIDISTLRHLTKGYSFEMAFTEFRGRDTV